MTYSQVERMPDDTSKVEAYFPLVYDYISKVLTDSCLLVGKKALAISEKINYVKGVGRAHSALGTTYTNMGMFNEAYQHLMEAEKISIEVNDQLCIANNYRRIGAWYNFQGLGNQSLEYLLKSDSVFQNYNYPDRYFTVRALANGYHEANRFGLAKTFALTGEKLITEFNLGDINLEDIYNLLGVICRSNKEFSASIEYYSKALPLVEKINSDYKRAALLAKIGNVYADKEQWTKALEYLNQSEEISKRINVDTLSLINTYGSFSEVYKMLNNPERSLYYLNKALLLAQNYGDLKVKTEIILAISAIYIAEKKYPLALQNLKLAEDWMKRSNNREQFIRLFVNYCNYYSSQGIYQRAVDYGMRALNLSKELKLAYNVADISDTLSVIYERAGDYKQSNYFLKSARKRKDSIQSVTDNEKLIEQQTILDLTNKEFQIRSFKEQEEIQKIKLNKQRTFIWGLGLIVFLALISTFLLFRANAVKRRANELLGKQKEEITHQKLLIEESNKNMTDSIRYAKRIQYALLPSQNYLHKHAANHFVLYKPKDIVSGDFYWAMGSDRIHRKEKRRSGETEDNSFLIATADCTGHGVPGAFMSMIGISFLNQIVLEKNIQRPDLVLNDLKDLVIEALNPEGIIEEGKDGMDMVFCSFDFEKMQMQFASANNSFYIIRNNELIEYKADKFPIGKQSDEKQFFTLNSVELQKGDLIYTFTDGFADQFGGPQGKKFKYKQLKEVLLSIHGMELSQQREALNQIIAKWTGNLEQVDDILVIGIKV